MNLFMDLSFIYKWFTAKYYFKCNNTNVFVWTKSSKVKLSCVTKFFIKHFILMIFFISLDYKSPNPNTILKYIHRNSYFEFNIQVFKFCAWLGHIFVLAYPQRHRHFSSSSSSFFRFCVCVCVRLILKEE